MEGTIQIRAGRAVCVNQDGSVFPVGNGPDSGQRLMAGDHVILRSGGEVRLIARTPVWTVGVVVKVVAVENVEVETPMFAPFRTAVTLGGASVGDRTIVYLDEEGGAQAYGVYPSGAAYDAILLRTLYSQTTIPANVAAALRGEGASYYTINDQVDHRDLDTFTVDPETSIDLDDAISIDASAGVLYVHIVDIHRAIPVGSDLDESMCRFGSTLYLANEHTEHLLPSGILRSCSLDVGMERIAITVRMTLDGSGAIVDYGIYPSVIRVKRRMAYRDLRAEGWLWDRASVSSAVTLAIPGLDLRVGADGRLQAMEAIATNDPAHRIVSFAMIAANFVVSAHLRRHGVALPNRFHEAVRGLEAGDVATVTGNPTVDAYLAVKRWHPARYDVERAGHFGLGLREYCHFTSPMRRYADVLVHRILAGVRYDGEWLASTVDRLNDRLMSVKRIHSYYRVIKIARFLTGRAADGVALVVYATKVARSGVSWFSPDFLVNGYTHVSRIGDGRRWMSVGEDRLRGGDVEIRVGTRFRVVGLSYDFGNGIYQGSLEPLV